MKSVVYIIIVLSCGLLFLPRGEGHPIRNGPLLIVLLSLIFVCFLVELIRRILSIIKIVKIVKQKGYELEKITFIPSNRLVFSDGEKTLCINFILKKRSYIHYHFDSKQRVILYKYVRAVYNHSKVFGPKIARNTERRYAGKIRLIWEGDKSKDSKYIVLFDRLPDMISNSRKKEGFYSGDTICGEDVYLYDLKSLEKANIP